MLEGRAKLRPSITRIVRCPGLSSGLIFCAGGAGELVREGTGVCDRDGTSASLASTCYRKEKQLYQNARRWCRATVNGKAKYARTFAQPVRHMRILLIGT